MAMMNILHNQLKDKLANLQAWKDKQDKHLHAQQQDLVDNGTSEIKQIGTELDHKIERFSKLYIKPGQKIQQNSEAFVFQKDLDDLFREEEAFTACLTKYTREQFAGGVADLANGRDKSKYELLDTNKPETFLGKGSDCSGKNREREELKRLQSVYLVSKRNAVAAEMSHLKYGKAVEVAERQLKMLKTMNLDVTAEQIAEKVEDLSQDTERYQSTQDKCFVTELLPLLERLQVLASTKVIQGDYNLKLLRQDYFVSKQDEVIKQLLIQFSRNYYLAMVYEIEYKHQRGTHHLFSALYSLLEKEVEKLDKQIILLNDILSGIKSHSQIIYSNDKFMNMLHEALHCDDNNKTELYRSCNQVVTAANNISSFDKQGKMRLRDVEEELSKKFNLIEEVTNKLDEVMQIPEKKTNEELSLIISDVEENLLLAESQINHIIEDIMEKKTLLSIDNVEDLKRKVWADFFNDPGRLKRSLEDLIVRVKGFASTN